MPTTVETPGIEGMSTTAGPHKQQNETHATAWMLKRVGTPVTAGTPTKAGKPTTMVIPGSKRDVNNNRKADSSMIAKNSRNATTEEMPTTRKH
jgi:hypothetical protein